MAESQATVNRSRVAQSSSNPLLLNVIKQIEQPVMVVDDDLFILQVNPRAERILHGTTRETRQCHLASVLRTTGIATQIQAAITHHKPSVFHRVFLQPTMGNASQKITLKVAPLDPGSGCTSSAHLGPLTLNSKRHFSAYSCSSLCAKRLAHRHRAVCNRLKNWLYIARRITDDLQYLCRYRLLYQRCFDLSK